MAKRPNAIEATWPALNTQLRPIADVIAYQRNPVDHPDDQVVDLMAMIKEFGWTMPILVDDDGQIIAGHGRLLAAQRMRLERVPVATAEGWSASQRKAYRLADNQIARRSTYIPEFIESELGELEAMNFDTSRFGLADMLPELEDVEAAPAPPRAPRKSTTIFVTVPNADAERARKAIASALDKLKVPHGL